MKNVSIYEKKWLDLVFEGKNKEYGAYQLRQENSKTTTFAFALGIIFLSGFVFLLSSFSDKSILTPIDDKGIKITAIEIIEPPIVAEPKVAIIKPKSNLKTPDVLVTNAPPVVVETRLALLDVPTSTIQPATINTTEGTIKGGIEPYNAPNSGTTISVLPTTVGPIKTSDLDKQPDFPGGIKNFYEYIGTHFDKEITNEGTTIKVKVSFVIEKNGVMTDIKVVDKNNYSIDNEAIRVLKSLKTKWTPGIKNGEPVRTLFTLPITVVL